MIALLFAAWGLLALVEAIEKTSVWSLRFENIDPTTATRPDFKRRLQVVDEAELIVDFKRLTSGLLDGSQAEATLTSATP
jgi:hypothetical protein